LRYGATRTEVRQVYSSLTRLASLLSGMAFQNADVLPHREGQLKPYRFSNQIPFPVAPCGAMVCKFSLDVYNAVRCTAVAAVRGKFSLSMLNLSSKKKNGRPIHLIPAFLTNVSTTALAALYTLKQPKRKYFFFFWHGVGQPP
jgi:hypothetical protein